MTLESLARKMMLTPAQAMALPATLDCAAEKVGMGRDEMVAQCAAKPALAEYLASVCRKAAEA